jgi:hypothetical protein
VRSRPAIQEKTRVTNSLSQDLPRDCKAGPGSASRNNLGEER